MKRFISEVIMVKKKRIILVFLDQESNIQVVVENVLDLCFFIFLKAKIQLN